MDDLAAIISEESQRIEQARKIAMTNIQERSKFLTIAQIKDEIVNGFYEEHVLMNSTPGQGYNKPGDSFRFTYVSQRVYDVSISPSAFTLNYEGNELMHVEGDGVKPLYGALCDKLEKAKENIPF